MLGMSMDSEDFSDVITTDSPSGLSPNAAMTQVSVGAKLYSPLCGPLPTLMLCRCCRLAAAPGAAHEREQRAMTTPAHAMRPVT